MTDKVPTKTADLLADIGAIDANLMSLPIGELERMEFYVAEREKLLRLLEALVREEPEPSPGLHVVADSTRVLRAKLNSTREKMLLSIQQADTTLRQLRGFQTEPNEGAGETRILSRLG